MDQEAYVMVMGKLVTISLSNFIKCEEIGVNELEISHYEKDFFGKWGVLLKLDSQYTQTTNTCFK